MASSRNTSPTSRFVAAYCAFMDHHGWVTTQPVAEKRVSLKGWAVDQMTRMFAEIDIWHRLYPRQVSYVTEEATAKVEGREPKHGPSGRFG